MIKMTGLTHFAAFFLSMTRWYGIARAPDGDIVVVCDTWHNRDFDMREFDPQQITEKCISYGADPSTLRWVWYEELTPAEEKIVSDYYRVHSMMERAATAQAQADYDA